MQGDEVTIRLTHDQALVLSDWLYRSIGDKQFDQMLDQDSAVWSPIYTLAGTLDKALPQVFAADYQTRLDDARRRLQPIAASPSGARRPVADAFAEQSIQISGWIHEQYVVRLLTYLSGYVGYSYGWLDEQALVGALDATDDETADRWFRYPLQGSPSVTVELARSPGSGVVAARVLGPMDSCLAARVETLMDVLSGAGEEPTA